jgi:hypothetical protein
MSDDVRSNDPDGTGNYGPQETDDTTEADAGLTGGTGAVPGEATYEPGGAATDDEVEG